MIFAYIQDTIYGGTGADILYGNAEVDIIFGETGSTRATLRLFLL